MPKTPVLAVIGSTEGLTLLSQVPDREDWQFIGFSPCLGLEFLHRWDDLHEMIVVRKAEIEMFQAGFHNFAHLQKFPTEHLFSPHPQKANCWLHQGRTDDTVVFSNRDKLNPILLAESADVLLPARDASSQP